MARGETGGSRSLLYNRNCSSKFIFLEMDFEEFFVKEYFGCQITAPCDKIRITEYNRRWRQDNHTEYVKAMVEGFQEGLSQEGACRGMASCVKHFAAYGAAEGGRDYNTVDMSERRLRQEYLPSYRAGVEAGCEMVMTSFNTVDGIPATGNRWLMRQVLREEWGFDGVLITDYAAIAELMATVWRRTKRRQPGWPWRRAWISICVRTAMPASWRD